MSRDGNKPPNRSALRYGGDTLRIRPRFLQRVKILFGAAVHVAMNKPVDSVAIYVAPWDWVPPEHIPRHAITTDGLCYFGCCHE